MMRRDWLVLMAMTALSAMACGNFEATRPAPLRARPSHQPAVLDPDTHAITVYWIGHASVLIRLDDKWILTDPYFRDRLGIIEKRRIDPGMDPADLPPVDCVLISHAHIDHLDPSSLRRVNPSAALVVPPGVVPYLPSDLVFSTVVPVRAWQATEQSGVTITAVPARHSNGRYIIDGLWNRDAHTGYIIQYGMLTVYFAGDTGYDPALAGEIGARFDIDVALVPVGPANRAAWVHALRKHVHADPSDALRIFTDVSAQWMIPIHYGAFFKEPVAEIAAVRRVMDAHPLRDQVRMLPVGGAATFLY